MNTLNANYLDRFASISEEEFHDEEVLQQLMNDRTRMLDGWKEPYLTIRAFFRLAGLLPNNQSSRSGMRQSVAEYRAEMISIVS